MLLLLATCFFSILRLLFSALGRFYWLVGGRIKTTYNDDDEKDIPQSGGTLFILSCPHVYCDSKAHMLNELLIIIIGLIKSTRKLKLVE